MYSGNFSVHIGTDLVHIPTFATQLEQPGSTFSRVFTDRELRTCAVKVDRVASLAARWAAKEAYIKAWSQCLYGQPPVIGVDGVDFSEIEVVQDAFSRPSIELHGEVLRLGLSVASVSLSHDGDYATATVLVGGGHS